MKIFICEQNQEKAKNMQAILDIYSYRVVTFQRNSDLIRQIQQQSPAVIILNEDFTDSYGMDTLRKIKNDPITSKIPVIYIKNSDSSLKPVYDNFTQVIQEPIKIKNLRHFIDRWTTLRTLYVKH